MLTGFWFHSLLVALVCVLPGTNARAAELAPGDSQWSFTLDKSLPADKALTIHFDVRGGKITAALGSAKGYNARTHDIDASGLKLDVVPLSADSGLLPLGVVPSLRDAGARLSGTVKVTLNADPYFPVDGKTVAGEFAIDATASAGAVKGTYTGTCGAAAVRGDLAGTLSALPDAAAYRRFKLRFAGALARLYQARGPNWKYALDMDLSVPFRDGQFGPARFETPVPDYRRYTAVVKTCALKLDGPRLSGTLAVLVDYGGQGNEAGGSRAELHEYTLAATVIAEVVGGRFDVKIGQLQAKDCALHGAVSFAAPPRPSQSLAWLRLHGGIKDNQPILLSLSLSDQWPLHGLAYCPSENHQPHAVDASKLKLDGNALKGEVKVTVYPDVYRGGEPFDVRCTVDAKIDGAEVSGAFSGEDRDVKTAGAITGEIRPRAAPAVAGLAQLRQCQLGLGYCLVSGALPHQKGAAASHATVTLTLRDGKVVSAVIGNAEVPDAYAAGFDAAELELTGDRLTGWVEFTVTSKSISEGKYRFELEAVIDGDKFSGFWRGTHKGKAILTKSAKLGGRLIPAGGEAGRL